MSHPRQIAFFQSVKLSLPKFFKDTRVLDVGALDINGNNRMFFESPYYYVGLDLAEGPNITTVCPGHLYDCGHKFDVVISSECFEHDMYYARTIQNMVRLLRPGGLMAFSCATTGRPEHGTLNTTPTDSPFTTHLGLEWANYYKNLTESDIRSVIDVNLTFSDFGFSTDLNEHVWDLYFWGIKN